MALARGPVETRRAGTSGYRTTAGSSTYQTAPKRKRWTVIGYTTTGDATTLCALRSAGNRPLTIR